MSKPQSQENERRGKGLSVLHLPVQEATHCWLREQTQHQCSGEALGLGGMRLFDDDAYDDHDDHDEGFDGPASQGWSSAT